MTTLADYMHGLGLGWWIKNPDDTGDSYATDMYPLADAVLTEQCNQYSSCGLLSAYVGHKAVFNAEYHLTPSAFCSNDDALGFNGARFNLGLTGIRKTVSVALAAGRPAGRGLHHGREGRSGVTTNDGRRHRHQDEPRSVADTVRLLSETRGKGMKVFAVIDHSGEARAHGLELRDTMVVIFGSPEAGTPVMASRTAGRPRSPLKVLVWDGRMAGRRSAIPLRPPSPPATA